MPQRRWGFGQLAVRYTTELGRGNSKCCIFFLFFVFFHSRPAARLGSWQFLEEVEDIIRLKKAVWGLGLL